MKKQFIIFLLALLSAAVCLAVTPAPAKVEKPDHLIPAEGCVTDKCHVNVKASKALHGPVAKNACDACHEPVDIKKHTYRATRQGAALCTYCHDFKVTNIPVVHRPVAKGECLGCHDPHGGVSTALTREQSTAAMCGRCHDSLTRDKKFVHGPVGKGECGTCHTAHASRFPKLLHAEGEKLCYSCHKDLGEQVARSKFKHEALGDGCLKCHEVHASNFPAHAKQAAPGLCTSCHDKVKEEVATVRHKHSPVMEDRSCLTCHTSHGGNLAYLMNDIPAQTCMRCHNEPTKTARGTVVAALTEVSDPATHKHGPIREGQCTGCHKAHGSDLPMFLVKANAGDFYQQYSLENYGLCFSCHEPQLAEAERSDRVTAFRNGDLNLHFIHANHGERGRNCRVCHSTHASRNEHHVNETVAFGQWPLPIKFTKTQTGGNCETGCHKPYAYDRVKPVPSPTTRPAPREVVATGRSGERPTEPIRWALDDVLGGSVKIPAENKPTILMFLRSGDIQNAPAVKMIKAAANEKAATVVIVGGAEALSQARRLAEEYGNGLRFVPDVRNQWFEKLEVYVWPTIFLVGSDGAQITRLAGAPESTAMRLEAHVDFAARRIDSVKLQERLTKIELAGETPAWKAARLMQVAEKNLRDGKIEQGRQDLAEAVAAWPESVPARVALIKVLLRLNKVDDAAAVLETLKNNLTVAPLLEARILIARGERREARERLLKMVETQPKLAEAHYLLGTMYEDEGEWMKAAAAYRSARESEQTGD